MDVGAMTPNLWLFEIREDCLNFFERASARACTRLVPARRRAIRTCRSSCSTDIGDWLDKRLPVLFEDAISLVADNRIFKQRNVDIAIVSKKTRSGGVFGTMIRGSGIPWDLRKSQPLYVYDRMEFDIPVGTRGRLL
jgi:NADH-quinone oxidoreductase subunit D